MTFLTRRKAVLLCAALSCALLFPLAAANAIGKPSRSDKIRNTAPAEEMMPHFTSVPFRVKGRFADRIMTYFWAAPDEPYPDGIEFPLVVVLHGSPGNAYAAKYLLSSAVRMQHPSFVLVPVLPRERTWATWQKRQKREDTELANVVKMIQSVSEQHPIDPSRIYVIGCSEGGFGAFGAALYFPDIFAAAVPISGGWNPEDAKDMTKIPILSMHGTKDDVLPVEMTRDVSQLIREYGGNISYNEFPDMGHECPSTRLYSNALWQWLFAQQKAPVSE